MTRTEFVKAYADRSGLSDKWAGLGIVDVGGSAMAALPCGCGDETCEGWAMVTANSIIHHLEFCAPEPLRGAYHDAVRLASAHKQRGQT